MIIYLLEPAESTYLEMKNNAYTLINNYDIEIKQKEIGLTNSRILVTFPDGNVVYDSAKGDNNTHQKALEKSINENHMNRISIMIAFLSKLGLATEKKYSTTTNKNEEYMAERLGSSVEDPIGCVRFSLEVPASLTLRPSAYARPNVTVVQQPAQQV
jgi:hypothetical protein